jgi:hypothetical protein
MRVRYAFAAAVALAWCVALSVVADGWNSTLQAVVLAAGGVIAGAIAWPDDFKRNAPTRRDGPPSP